MPKSALTGTEKKAKKAEINFQKELRQDYKQEFRAKRGLRRFAGKALKDIAMGKKGPSTKISDLMKDFKKTQKFAEKHFEPIKKQALSEFHQHTIPGISSALGSESKSSSALNQALAASGENLQRSLASDFANLQTNLGQNFLQQQEQGKLQKINAMLSAGGAGLGQQAIPQGVGLGMAPSYLAKGNNPGVGRRIGSSLAQGALGGLGGFLVGGPVGAAVGAVGGGLGGALSP